MGIIKVADFGLSECLYTKEYFKQTSDSNLHVKLPIKWMALEIKVSIMENSVKKLMWYSRRIQ